jgi:hypothetical protein
MMIPPMWDGAEPDGYEQVRNAHPNIRPKQQNRKDEVLQSD